MPLKKGIERIDTVNEIAEVVESVAEIGLVVGVIVGGLNHVAEFALELFAGTGLFLGVAKISSLLYRTWHLHSKAQEYETGTAKKRRQERAKYARMLADTVNDIGDDPMPKSLQKEIVRFYIQEIEDANSFKEFVEDVESIRERIPRRRSTSRVELLSKELKSLKKQISSNMPFNTKAYLSDEHDDAYRVSSTLPYIVY